MQENSRDSGTVEEQFTADNCKSIVYVSAFSRCFYPKQITNEDIKLQLKSKLTISYIEGNHKSDSVRGDISTV